jgi:cytoskeletal protein CcmA (bactofilin family)
MKNGGIAMFDQVKHNVGRWNRQQEEADTSAAVEPARPAAPRGSSPTQGLATIGPSIRIKGDLVGEENLVIEGQVEGTIHLDKNDLTIGSNGRVKANVHAKGVIVEGQLEGDILGKEKVVIRRTGNMRGNIVAPRVTLEDGAMFKGSIEMEPEVRHGSAPLPEKDPGTPPLTKEALTAAASNAVKAGKL